jgi:hypothetical protein
MLIAVFDFRFLVASQLRLAGMQPKLRACETPRPRSGPIKKSALETINK